MMRTIWTVSGQERPNKGRRGHLRLDRALIASAIGEDWLLFTSRTKDHRGQFNIVSQEIAFGLQLSFYILGSA